MTSSEFFATQSSNAVPGSAEAASRAFVVPLSHLGAIEVAGPDAATFLHSQLTNEVLAQPADVVVPTGYCTAKGRLIATLWQRRDASAQGEPAIRLIVARDLAAAVAKRLSMYVLRAKAKVRDVSELRIAIGLTLPHGVASPIALPPQVNGVLETVDYAVARVPDAAGLGRYLFDVEAERAASLYARLAEFAAPAANAWWRLTDVRAGLPHVVAATTERFVPQMINFELIGGVNFRKGCYPGQEIVARSQYLGKLKRRMFFARMLSHETPAPGADVHAAGSADAVGTVVNAERVAGDHVELLVETTWVAADMPLAVGGAPLELGALPYDVPREQSAA